MRGHNGLVPLNYFFNLHDSRFMHNLSLYVILGTIVRVSCILSTYTYVYHIISATPFRVFSVPVSYLQYVYIYISYIVYLRTKIIILRGKTFRVPTRQPHSECGMGNTGT